MNKRRVIVFCFLVFLFIFQPTLLFSQDTPPNESYIKNRPSIEEEGVVIHARAKVFLRGTVLNPRVRGSIALTQVDSGVYVDGQLYGVDDAGKHGIHIHENGSCDDNGKGAGGHYNPHATSHGLFERDGVSHAHPGDMGNVVIGPTGGGQFVAFLPGLTLEGGELNVGGLAVILHAKEDDFGQPTGNAGGRIGCGLIVVDAVDEDFEEPDQADVQEDEQADEEDEEDEGK